MAANTDSLFPLGPDQTPYRKLSSDGVKVEKLGDKSFLTISPDAIRLLGLDDAAVEINVTPDRGYAFSIRGVAREYAHATGAVFRDPAEQDTAATVHAESGAADAFPVEIRDDAPIRGRVGSSVFAMFKSAALDEHAIARVNA